MDPEVFSKEQDQREIGCTTASPLVFVLRSVLTSNPRPHMDLAVHEAPPLNHDNRIRSEASQLREDHGARPEGSRFPHPRIASSAVWYG